MRKYINIVTDQMLNEAMDYMAMFKNIIEEHPDSAGFFNSEVKWAKKTLKKNDRIVCYLKSIRSIYEATLDRDFMSAIRAATVSVKRQAEHYLSLNLAKIDNLHWDANEGVYSVLDRMAEFEKEWLENRRGNVEPQDGDKIVIKFPDGSAWWQLNRAGCRAEGNSMGHCGNMPSMKQGQTILSYRTPVAGHKNLWRPHLTFIRFANGHLGEMKGRANEKPQPKYHPYIVELLKHPELVSFLRGGGYAANQNFFFDDLNDAQKEEVLAANPNILTRNVSNIAVAIAAALEELLGETFETEDDKVLIKTLDHTDTGRRRYSEPYFNEDAAFAFKVYSNVEDYEVYDVGDYYYDEIWDKANQALKDRIMEKIKEEFEEELLEYIENEGYDDISDFSEEDVVSFIKEHDIDEINYAFQMASTRGYEVGGESEMYNQLKDAVENIHTQYKELTIMGDLTHDGDRTIVKVWLKADNAALTFVEQARDDNDSYAIEDGLFQIRFNAPQYGYNDFDQDAADEEFENRIEEYLG